MAYAAVISLQLTIDRLLNSFHFWIRYSSRQILESAYKEATSLQEVLKRFDDGRFRSSRRLDALDGEIRDAVRDLEDVIDFSADVFLSQSQDSDFPQKFSLDMEGDQISSFADKVKKMNEDYIEELENALLKQEDEDGDFSSSSGFDFGTVEMVGFSNEFTSLKKKVLKCTRPYEFGVFSVTGEAGTGRMLVAKCIFEGVFEEKRFDCHAWVSVGRMYDLKEILLSIVDQIDDDHKLAVDEEQQNIVEYLQGCLKDRSYMIVLDDVWDTHLLELIKTSFPDQRNESMVLLTTSLEEVALSANSYAIHFMLIYVDELCWHLLQNMMGECVMTPEMEEAGMKIAKNCRGLQMVVTRVGIHLEAAEKTPEYWKKLAADEHNPVFLVSDEISKKREIIEDLKLNFSRPNEQELSDIEKKYFDYSDNLKSMKEEMFPKTFFPKMETIAVLGMAGIGKTTLVKKIFGDPSILCHFDYHVWLTLGPKCQSKELLVDILFQIYPNADRRHIKGERILSKYLRECLSSKRCLIVLDDLWTSEPLHYLKKVFREVHGKVVLTTRHETLDRDGLYDKIQEVSLLSEKESWQLFCQKVFVDGSCPPELEKAGRRISENCERLPLLILTVADILSKAEKTLEYWNEVSEEQSSVFVEANQKLSKVLTPSYQILPQHLKACFLYMGVFLQKHEISTTKLINYWIVEGLLKPNKSRDIRDFAENCLLAISHKSLIMVLQRGTNSRIKTSALHSVFWYLSNSEAAKNKLFLAMRKRSDSIVEDRKGQRRLCIRNNVLFAIKDVHASLASFSAARSLLCTGPYHQYPVPMCFCLRLLRVLSALTIRFYEFPIEVVKLIHLRYLALICSTELPLSISKLQNLQFLIVNRHMSIKYSDSYSYMPMEIWDMKELNHLQVTGSNLPDPRYGVFLLNLSTLLDMSADSCTNKVLEGIPYLKRLRIQIELGPDDNHKAFHCLNNISSLGRLESLSCVVVDPQFGLESVIPPAPISMFPSSLEKLTLSGLGYPWEYMSIISKLKNLKVLKLQCYAFRGPVWETKEDEFLKLERLSIEDSDLVYWRKGNGSFEELSHLSIKHCYKLQELPSYFISRFDMIEVENSNPLVETWAKRIVEMRNKYFYSLQVHSLLDAANQ